MKNQNKSFESVHPNAINGNINFDGGERVKICVLFENNNFDITNVREFVAQLPVEGWQITFSGDSFTMQHLFAPQTRSGMSFSFIV